ncbi:GNAT family N-acetyltransferase [Quadrisphaera sp. DSM 44207]|uniref:GNAT family N-acetyltransferase n=1 Tax=Quadrisphaera sp. DSM 44207 TaxID=1881057 RepID=UPI0008809371|nr:GNAT family N-acetyltransferase [Quadrisphaera sp. DSM 44207]SDQ76486.1 Acetyltransferase (GNAT) family protein [Quadrisphaera sp. DSM 44207]
MRSAPAPSPGGLVLEDASYDSDLVQELVREVQAEYVVRYGGEDATPLRSEEFTAAQGGAFVVARVGEQVVGCAGVRARGPGVAELKRLYVRATQRRRGHARQLLRAVEERARALGATRLVLETGSEQPEALAMYAAEGYAPVAAFGHYATSPTSRHLGKDL